MGWLDEGMTWLRTRALAEKPTYLDAAHLERFTASNGLVTHPEIKAFKVTSLAELVRFCELPAQELGLPGNVGVSGEDGQAIVFHVVAHNEVQAWTPVQEPHKSRSLIAVASGVQTCGFSFGRYMPPEDFIVGVQTCFAESEGRAAVLRLAGNLRPERIETLTDDGVTQVAAVRKSAGRTEGVKLDNPVPLQPWIGFDDLEPPMVGYVLRLHAGKIEGEPPQLALFEIGGTRALMRYREVVRECLVRLIAESELYAVVLS